MNAKTDSQNLGQSERTESDLQSKSIYAYDNYRSYLQDTYRVRKATDKKFSFRNFARIAGFKSPSFLKLVMDGKSNLSSESIEKFSKALKHNRAEAQYFRLLVLMNQSTTSDEKRRYRQEILRSRAYRRVNPLDESIAHYLSKWYFVVIKEMVGLPGFQEDPNWIADRLGGEVSPREVRRAIEEMTELGILGRTPDGALTQIKTFLMTANEVVSGAAAEYHREMARRAAASIDKVPREKRELSAVTVGVSKETASKIKEMLQQFREKLMEMAIADDSPELVYQVNLHLFPLVDPGNEET